MNAVRASQRTKGLGILLAFLVAIYGGTNGATSIITALNIAYEEKEKRSLVRFYLAGGVDDLRRIADRRSCHRRDGRSGLPSAPAAEASRSTVVAGKVGGYML